MTLLDWTNALKAERAYDSKVNPFDVGLMYAWYLIGVGCLMLLPGLPTLGIIFLGMSVLTFVRLNRKFTGVYYRSWPYAMFLFRVRINMEHLVTTYSVEILDFCKKTFPTTRWYYSGNRLYIKNKKMLVTLKLRFPDLVDDYVREKENEK